MKFGDLNRVMKNIARIWMGVLAAGLLGLGTGAVADVVNDKTEMEVPAGREFTITLASNPTTGYSWQLAGAPDEKIAKLVGSKFNAPQTDLVGAPGEEVWTFTAVAPGKTTLTFHYVRPWEKGIPPVEENVVDVTVK